MLTEQAKEQLHEAVRKGGIAELKKLIEKIEKEEQQKQLDKQLLEAVKSGDIAEVKELIEKNGADVNAKNEFGQTTLTLASMEGHFEIVKFLLDHGAGTDIAGEDKTTALHFAAFRGYKNIVELLINRGANINAQDDQDRLTPLHFAAESCHTEVVKLLLDNGANPNIKNKHNETPIDMAKTETRELLKKAIEQQKQLNKQLLEAVEGKNKDKVIELISKGADVRTKNSEGRTLLHINFGKGRYDIRITESLIKAGANVNEKDSEGETPLHAAVKEWHDKAVKLLIDKGADVNALYPDGDSPLHKAVERGLDLTKALLYRKEINVNHQGKNGDTPLHRVLKHINANIVKALLKVKGIKLDLLDNEGHTPLHTAVKKCCSTEIIKSFIDAGANVKAKDNEGKTPMHFAGDAEVVKSLIDAGADVNAKDNKGKTSLEIALEKKRTGKMMQLLIKHTLPQNPKIKPSGLQERDLAYWKRCEGEIRAMGEYKLGDGVTLFDILTTNDKGKLALYVSNENIEEALKSNINAIRKNFSIYAGQIEKQCIIGLDEFERRCAVEKIVHCVSAKKQQNFNIKECDQVSEKDIDKKGLQGLSQEEIDKQKLQEIDKKGVLGLNEYALREALKYLGTDLLRDIAFPRSNLSTTSVKAKEEQQREK